MQDTSIPFHTPQGESLGALKQSGYDSATFGFAVGSVTPDWQALEADVSGFSKALAGAAATCGLELVSCAIGAGDYRQSALLQSAGFLFVEGRLQMRAIGVRHKEWPDAGIRLCVAADRDRLLDISGRVFVDGRYTADQRFPEALAQKRNRILIEQALDIGNTDRVQVWVAGPEGAPHSFLYIRRDGKKADYQLGAADTDEGNGLAAMRLFAIYAAVATRLRSEGVREIKAQIAASNTAVGQIYQRIGFTLDGGQLMYHWVAPTAPHLDTFPS
jgi:hypothetical protein